MSDWITVRLPRDTAGLWLRREDRDKSVKAVFKGRRAMMNAIREALEADEQPDETDRLDALEQQVKALRESELVALGESSIWRHIDKRLAAAAKWRPQDEAEARARHAAEVLDVWAQALRGDWSQDGRTSRIELAAISEYLRGERSTVTFDDVGVCRNGHWPDYCDVYGCKGEEADE